MKHPPMSAMTHGDHQEKEEKHAPEPAHAVVTAEHDDDDDAILRVTAELVASMTAGEEEVGKDTLAKFTESTSSGTIPVAPIVNAIPTTAMVGDGISSIDVAGAAIMTDDKVIAERFRTKRCRNFFEKGHCPYDARCMFAHGEHQLRTTEMNLRDGLTSETSIKEFKRKLGLKVGNESSPGKTNNNGKTTKASKKAPPALSEQQRPVGGGSGISNDNNDPPAHPAPTPVLPPSPDKPEPLTRHGTATAQGGPQHLHGNIADAPMPVPVSYYPSSAVYVPATTMHQVTHPMYQCQYLPTAVAAAPPPAVTYVAHPSGPTTPVYSTSPLLSPGYPTTLFPHQQPLPVPVVLAPTVQQPVMVPAPPPPTYPR